MNEQGFVLRSLFGSGAGFLVLVLALAVLSSSSLESVRAQEQPPAIEEFVPFEGVPEIDQIPAARVLIAAYGVVWILAFGYLWSIWRRLSKVERDLSTLSRRKEE